MLRIVLLTTSIGLRIVLYVLLTTSIVLRIVLYVLLTTSIVFYIVPLKVAFFLYTCCPHHHSSKHWLFPALCFSSGFFLSVFVQLSASVPYAAHLPSICLMSFNLHTLQTDSYDQFMSDLLQPAHSLQTDSYDQFMSDLLQPAHTPDRQLRPVYV